MREWANTNVLIAGAGISGMGAKFALEKAGANCFMYDDSVSGDIAKNIDLIVVSPAFTKEHAIFSYAKEHNIEIIAELELGGMFNCGDIVAITGTNGKTTVTELAAAMLNNGGVAARACGNIGVSFAKTASEGDYKVAVVESSSFQLENIVSFHPHIAVITNISADHLDRHKTIENYAKIKLGIAKNQDETNYLVLSQDDIPLYLLSDFSPRANVLYTSTRGKVLGAYVCDGKIYFMDEFICGVERVHMFGAHNIANALSAIVVAKLYGVSNNRIIDTLTTFVVDAHRVQFVDRAHGKNYYNDSKGTNIGACVMAAKSMSGDTCLILGGSDKGYEFDELFRLLPKTITRIVSVGETSKKVYAAAARNGFYNIDEYNSLRDATFAAAAGEEENVLLSPAAASFDMFRDYADRGNKFVAIVEEIKNL